MTIKTEFIYPPIPPRDFDWCAVDDDYEEGDLIAFGKTKKEAIDNYKLLRAEQDVDI